VTVLGILEGVAQVFSDQALSRSSRLAGAVSILHSAQIIKRQTVLRVKKLQGKPANGRDLL
jgi:hypothetical protein